MASLITFTPNFCENFLRKYLILDLCLGVRKDHAPLARDERSTKCIVHLVEIGRGPLRPRRVRDSSPPYSDFSFFKKEICLNNVSEGTAFY